MMKSIKVLLIFVLVLALSAVTACEDLDFGFFNVFNVQDENGEEISETGDPTSLSDGKTSFGEESDDLPTENSDDTEISGEEEASDGEDGSDEEETSDGEDGTDEEETSDGEDGSDEEETSDSENSSDEEETSDSEDSSDGENTQEQEDETEYTSSEFFIFNKINGKEEYSVRIKPSEKDNLPDEIYIPAEYNGCKVVEIEETGFAQTEITKIVIPESVIRILERAFLGCANLKRVVFKDASGWKVRGEEGFKQVFEDLTNSETVATLMTTEYVDMLWKKS